MKFGCREHIIKTKPDSEYQGIVEKHVKLSAEKKGYV